MNNPIYVPFPLSSGECALLSLPKEMSVRDARRLKRAIDALYIVGQAKEPSKEVI